MKSSDGLKSQRVSQQFFDNKRESLRYYSPTSMCINRALSRLSSVQDFQKIQDLNNNRIESQRKSVQNIKPKNAFDKYNSTTTTATAAAGTGLSTMYTAQLVMNAKKQSMGQL